MLLQYFTSKILTNQYLEVLLLNRQLPVGKRSRSLVSLVIVRALGVGYNSSSAFFFLEEPLATSSQKRKVIGVDYLFLESAV